MAESAAAKIAGLITQPPGTPKVIGAFQPGFQDYQ